MEKADLPPIPYKRLQSTAASFDFKLGCFYCGSNVSVDSKHPQKEVYFPVRTISLYDNVLDVCEKRGQDKWATKVAARLKCCSDLVAAEAVHHKHCYNRFHFGPGKDLTGRESVQDPTTSH